MKLVRNIIGLETEFDKQIKAIQTVDSSITKEQATNLIKAGMVK